MTVRPVEVLDPAAFRAAVEARWIEFKRDREPMVAALLEKKRPAVNRENTKRANEILKSRRSNDWRIEQVYALVEKVVAIARPVSPCKKGCAHCCHIPVLITNDEAELIGRRIGVKPANAPVRYKGDPLPASGYDTPCVFLDAHGACSIYENRPLACRAYLVVDRDPLLCMHGEDGSNKVAYLDMRDYTDLLAMITAKQVVYVMDDGSQRPDPKPFPDKVGMLNEYFPHGKRYTR